MTTAEILEISKIRVLQNVNCLYFIIKYTIPIHNNICKKFTLFPVPERVLYLEGSNIVAECENKVHAVQCEKSMFATFCKILKMNTCG